MSTHLDMNAYCNVISNSQEVATQMSMNGSITCGVLIQCMLFGYEKGPSTDTRCHMDDLESIVVSKMPHIV